MRRAREGLYPHGVVLCKGFFVTICDHGQHLPGRARGVNNPSTEYAGPRMSAQLPPKILPAKTKYAWSSAFAAYLQGFDFRTIAEEYDIPQRTLEAFANDQRWATLAATTPIQMTAQAAKVKKPQVEELLANRRKNYELWSELREELMQKVEALRRGELKISKVFYSAKTGESAIVESDPNPGDLVDLANAIRTMADGTYRSLGDVVSDSERGAKGPSIGEVKIYLPSLVMKGTGKDSAPWEEAKQAVVELPPRLLDIGGDNSDEDHASDHAAVDESPEAPADSPGK